MRNRTILYTIKVETATIDFEGVSKIRFVLDKISCPITKYFTDLHPQSKLIINAQEFTQVAFEDGSGHKYVMNNNECWIYLDTKSNTGTVTFI